MKIRFLTKLICIAAVLSLVSFGTAYADYSIPSYLRIGLYFGANALNSATVTSEGGFYIGTYSGTKFNQDKQVSATELRVSFENGGVVVREGDTVVSETADGARGIGVFPTRDGINRRLTIGGEEYRGGLDFKVVNGANVITNVVFTDNYLYGVISREMSPSWAQEALKAQAVCARNYAANNLNKHKEYGFDLCNNVCCQAYSGTRFETEDSYAPVDETSNQVLTYDGKLAELYYSAAAGAKTEDVKNVWGSSVPYLVSVDNSFEDTFNIPNGVWTGTLTREEATTIMRNKGYSVGEVTDIKAIEYTDSGRVLKLEVTGTTGTKVFEREACRTIFNTVTKSQAFSVRGNGEGARNVPEIRATDGNDIANKKIDEVVMITGSGMTKLNSLNMYVSDGVYQKNYNIKQTSGTGVNTSFIFDGTGWGHGVGMSQYGAKGMAEQGYSYVDILLHYFPGTNLENAY